LHQDINGQLPPASESLAAKREQNKQMGQQIMISAKINMVMI